MECWHCERPAHANCKFCGRAVCKADAKQKPYILHSYRTATGEYKAIVVPDAVYCGICNPEQDPVTLTHME